MGSVQSIPGLDPADCPNLAPRADAADSYLAMKKGVGAAQLQFSCTGEGAWPEPVRRRGHGLAPSQLFRGRKEAWPGSNLPCRAWEFGIREGLEY